MRWIGVVVAVAMAGCLSSPVVPPPDGGIEPEPRPGCPARPDYDSFNFFGESCTSEPYPVNTLCRDLAGWCIDGVCRPQCGLPSAPNCSACPIGTEHHAAAGACYCAP